MALVEGTNDKLTEWLIEHFGIKPSETRRVIIDIQPREIVSIYIVKNATEEDIISIPVDSANVKIYEIDESRNG